MEYGFALTLSPDAKVGSDFANDLLKQFEIGQESSLFSTLHNQEDSEEEEEDIEQPQQTRKEINNDNHSIQKEINNKLGKNHSIKETIYSSPPITTMNTTIITQQANDINNDIIMKEDVIPLKEKNMIINNYDNNNNINNHDKMDIDNDIKDKSMESPMVETEKNDTIDNNKNDNAIQEINSQVTPIVEPLTKTITTVPEQINPHHPINIYNNDELNYDLDNNSSINTSSRIHDHSKNNNNNNTFPRRSKTLKANSTAPKKRSLLRRSSAYLRQKFFTSSTSPTSTSPPLPTSKPNSQLDINPTITNKETPINHHRSIDNNDDNTTTNTTTTTNNNNNNTNTTNINHHQSESTTTATNDSVPTIPPMVTPSQYPPKPLTYSTVVDPPNDHHRGSFPILHSWRISMLDPRRKSEPVVQTKKRRSIF
ncbi:unnamed protein product [Cunninghamella blakesleeana]